MIFLTLHIWLREIVCSPKVIKNWQCEWMSISFFQAMELLHVCFAYQENIKVCRDLHSIVISAEMGHISLSSGHPHAQIVFLEPINQEVDQRLILVAFYVNKELTSQVLERAIVISAHQASTTSAMGWMMCPIVRSAVLTILRWRFLSRKSLSTPTSLVV